MKVLTLGLFLLLTFSVVTIPTIFADEDEDEWDDDEREYEQRGSGDMEREQEREREREHEDDDDDEGLALGGGMPDAILYGTIAVIIGSVAYTGFKIYKIKRPKLSASR
jgi:hypothetical protein